MTIIMQQTIRDSINGGATEQRFEKSARYDVPTAVGQLWIGRGWASVATMAKGGIVTGPRPAPVGDTGPEAFIPLDRLNGNGRKE